MKPWVLAVVAGAVGFVAAGLLIRPSDCCARVAAGVRSKVGDELGAFAVAAGDALGAWKYAPGLLTLLGVS